MTLTLSQILGESALKAAGLLVCAAVVVLILRRAPARIRAVVWSMALAGVILFPAATKLMPRWDVPLPHSVATKLSAFRPEVAPQLLEPELFGHPSQSLVHRESSRVVGPKIGEVANQPIAAASPSRISLAGLMLATWLCGLTAVLLWQAVGWLRVWTLVRRGQPLREARWGDLLERVARRVGVRRPIQVIVSSEISAPATWGWRCPVVLLPKRSENWIRERREVVLMHELVHVARFDWPLRMLARLAAAIYWFNPLSWWALHRLHTEQELACDEEVIALGTRASTYASHLLDIARAVIPQPMFGVAALGMARKSRVEGRIMAILERKTHRRVGMAVMIPAAVMTAVLIPVFAAVYPSFAGAQPSPVVVIDAPTRPASPELRSLINEMRDIEQEMEVHLDKMEIIEENMQPFLAEVEELDLNFDEEAMRAIEEQMGPYHERIEELHLEMEPILAQIEDLEIAIEPFHFDMQDINLKDLKVDLDGFDTDTINLHELMDLVHQQMEPMHEQMEAMQEMMLPQLEQIERLHAQLEPFHTQIEDLHIDMEPLHLEMEELHKVLEPMLSEKMEGMHEALEPFHLQMEGVHEELEPFHERLEALSERIKAEIVNDIKDLLRTELGSFVAGDALFNEAAEELLNRAGFHIDDEVLNLHLSERKARRILTSHFEGSATATDGEFAAAIERTAAAVTEFRVRIDD